MPNSPRGINQFHFCSCYTVGIQHTKYYRNPYVGRFGTPPFEFLKFQVTRCYLKVCMINNTRCKRLKDIEQVLTLFKKIRQRFLHKAKLVKPVIHDKY